MVTCFMYNGLLWLLLSFCKGCCLLSYKTLSVVSTDSISKQKKRSELFIKGVEEKVCNLCKELKKCGNTNRNLIFTVASSSAIYSRIENYILCKIHCK